MAPSNSKEEIRRFLTPGMKLNVSFEFGPDDKMARPATFIGLKDKHFVIIEIAEKDKEEFVLRKLENTDVVVRGIADTELGHIVAFKSSILTTIAKPAFLLFLRIPSNFATKPVREHVRYKVALSGMLTHNGNQYQGNLTDFSVSGCGFTTLVEPEFTKGAFVKVESTLNRFISADNGCHIASVRKMPNGWFVGITFEQEVRMTSELKRELLELSFKAGQA
ncbi:flagellar brake protein [Vibrio navarrensis]|uniref:Flagellar brake protein n=1 Tax=Vibrio navarrensis TaxID=29495 RepID=A0A099LTK6_9VIBR|nr:flagellar brake protein [Vibrio navarrensis]EGR2797356.1 flagellar brake protein [Vibrio navarrensis]EJL6396622.1 flagellar brake protein [Vibrio navarrensis]EKA5637707.1 flagellar brake protein [Vibrio navarrensis]ELN6932407.1 flagellar brake protein [Vibrio navarrensis]KGK11598.1 pilus assembly protein PilZ [Vibrio navarrensis]